MVKKVGADLKISARKGGSLTSRAGNSLALDGKNGVPLEIDGSTAAVLVRRLSKLDADLSKIPMLKKRDIFVKVSLEQHFGSEFVLSSQYEEVHAKVLEQLNCSNKTKGLDALLKKLV